MTYKHVNGNQMRNRSSTADSCFGKFAGVHLHLIGFLQTKKTFTFSPLCFFFLIKATRFPAKYNQSFSPALHSINCQNFVCHIIVALQIDANWPRNLMLIKKIQMDICKDLSGCQSCILAKLAFIAFKYTVVAGKSTKRLVKNTRKIN